MAATTGVREIVLALRQHGNDVESELRLELDDVAQKVAVRMRELAPKYQSTLIDSIRVYAPDTMSREIRPYVAYAPYVEDGVAPGGKGLPKFGTTASASIEAWLASKAPSSAMGPHPLVGKRKPRAGSRLFLAAQKALRDRYYGLIMHIRLQGLEPQPFVATTAQEMEPIVLDRMNAAVRRVLAARPDSGGAVA